MQKIEYEIGQPIGEITYLGYEFYRSGHRHALFMCKCGVEFNAQISKVKSSYTKSCGCLQKKKLALRNIKHSRAKRGRKTKEYNIWVLMKQRCYNPKTYGFINWGGRGIVVCDRWISSFDNFIEDMGLCPENCRGIDRENNDGNYEPSNCRWATQKQQMRNIRKNRMILFREELKTLAEWSEILEMPKGSYYNKNKRGFSDDEILLRYYLKKNNGEN